MSGGLIGETIENRPAAQSDFNRDSKPATPDALVVFLTEFACSLCTPIERSAYGDHCPHSAKRGREQAEAAEALREYADRYYVVIDLRECADCEDVA